MPEDNQNSVQSDTPSSDQSPTVTPANPEPSPNAFVGPAPISTVNPAAPTILSQNSSVNTSNKKKKLTLFAALAAGIVVLIVGSAAAYFGVVVPNKPENLLKTAFSNTASQRKVKFDGRFTYENTEKDAPVKAVNVAFNGQSDADLNAFQSEFKVAASGATVSLELRGIDKSIFFKVGDLGSIKGLAQAAAPAYAAAVDSVNKSVANQWIQVDETLLKQASAGCALDASFALTDKDIELLQKRYTDVPFADVKSHSDDKVNNRSAIKYEIELDDDKAAEYSKGLSELSIVKKMKECNPDQDTDSDLESLGDSDITPITIWVDKGNKQIVKIAGKSTKQDEEKDKFKADYELTMQYGQAAITKPEGAKPFIEVFGGLSQLLGGMLQGGINDDTSKPRLVDPSAVEGVSPECMRAIQDYANSNGTKPIPANCL